MTEETAVEAAPVPSGPADGIARGRMHAALVFAIKFNSGEAKDGDLARKYATTPGKINDIRKDRNFKYVIATMAFTAGEVQEAKDRFAASVNAENSTVAEDQRPVVIEDGNTALDGVPKTEGDSQLSNARKADRKPRGKSGDEAESEAGGEATAEAAEVDAASDDDLDGLLDE